MNVKFNEIAETVRNAFDFEVINPLSGADNHYTPWYGLFRDDTGDYVGSGSISELMCHIRLTMFVHWW